MIPKQSRFVFPLIVLGTLCLIAVAIVMWALIGSMQSQTTQHYNFIKNNILQRSSYIAKSTSAFYKILNFEITGNQSLHIKELKDLSKSIAGHQVIARDIIEDLLNRLPVDDPLLLHLQLTELLPKLQIVKQTNDSFGESLTKISTNQELQTLIDTFSTDIADSIAILEEYQNLHPQLQSHFFSIRKDNIQSFIQRLNLFFFILTVLLGITILLSFLYLKEKLKLQKTLISSHQLLEEKVHDRTADLERTNKQLAQEIEEREHVEFELRLISDALENSLNAFDIVDENSRFIYVNKAYVEMWGYDHKDEIIGDTPARHCQDPEMPKYIIDELKKNKQCIKEFVAQRKDGTVFDVLMYARLAQDENGREIYPTTSIDITERKNIQQKLREKEKQLSHARKMESVGNLAGGIAHEFNNMLAIIMGNNELVMEELPQNSLARESTEEIKVAGLRARDVVKQLLTFSSQDNSLKKAQDFSSVVRDSLKLIRTTTPANIKIEQKLQEESHPVLCNDTQISQLLIHLCNNAIDALPEKGGVITIELLNKYLEQSQTDSFPNLNPGHHIELTVRDNGIGMTKEILDRVFDPYYTTKEIGEGSGIGMAIVHGIVDRHGGQIIADSHPGEGTTFTIFLPVHKGPVEGAPDEQTELPGGAERILYVDDEPPIAKLGKRNLESFGYNIEAVTDPEKALELIRINPEKFDLVITDMAMPGMTGEQLITAILEIRSDIPTIICTGYSSKITEAEAHKIGAHAFIMKPINKRELAQQVRNILDRAQNS